MRLRKLILGWMFFQCVHVVTYFSNSWFSSVDSHSWRTVMAYTKLRDLFNSQDLQATSIGLTYEEMIENLEREDTHHRAKL